MKYETEVVMKKVTVTNGMVAITLIPDMIVTPQQWAMVFELTIITLMSNTTITTLM